MVCVPCIVIPVLLWVFHKFIQPFILKFWNKSSIKNSFKKEELDLTPEGRFIKNNIEENAVTLFSKASCRFCKLALEQLASLDISFHNVDIGDNKMMTEIQDLFEKLTGERTVPRIFINGECIGGYSDFMTLHNKGELLQKIKSTDSKKQN